MWAVMLVAHAPLASATSQVIQHILGALPEGFTAVDVNSDLGLDEIVQALLREMDPLGRERDVLILSDVYGATPCNAAVLLGRHLAAQSLVVAGMNVPMIIRALGFRHLPLAEVPELLLSGGRSAMMSIGPLNNSDSLSV